MANTPTSPPNRPVRRSAPPRGPATVARRNKSVETVRKHVQMAAQAVEPTMPDVAETLLELLGPHGYRKLQQSERSAVPTDASHQNLTIQVPLRLRSALQDAAEKAGPKGKSVTAVLSDAMDRNFAALLAGEVQPREIPKSPRGSAEESGNLNVPVDRQLLAQAREQVEEIGVRLGYSGRATVPKMAMSLLLEEFGISYEPPASKLEGMAQLQLPVPPRLAAAIRKKLNFTDSELRRLVDEGLRRAVAGEWEPWEVPKAPRGSDYERELLTTYVDRDLFDEARAASKSLRESLGFRVSPQTIATGWLASELGLDDLFDEEYGLTAETD